MYITLISCQMFVAMALLCPSIERRCQPVVEYMLECLTLWGMIVTAFCRSEVYGRATVVCSTTLCVVLALSIVGREWRSSLYRLNLIVVLLFGALHFAVQFPRFVAWVQAAVAQVGVR